jgi:hypothetical protein
MDVLDQFVDSILTVPAATVPGAWAMATVDSIDAGIVTVDWRGALVQAAHLDSYTPTVGDRVLCARVATQLVALGRLIGAPPSGLTN